MLPVLLVPTINAVDRTVFADDADVAGVAADLQLSSKELILIPLNNSRDDGSFSTPSASGTHWSTLAYEKTSNTFYSFDSLTQGFTLETAKRFAKKLGMHLESRNGAAPTITVAETPAQRNMYDCGMCYTL